MTGIERIAAERKRQLEAEGWSIGHDVDEHRTGQLTVAAIGYAQIVVEMLEDASTARPPMTLEDLRVSWPDDWPWEREWWKPSLDPIRNLEKAGALIASEIDRLEEVRARAAGASGPQRVAERGR